ncbi:MULTISPECIES: peptide chain release factor N(5)-glutamine methyltransferase [Moraxella]|uniref:Release factor glutamine methyltransferase n=1 Tax=Moraxella lacunata TaxID=477 RepID=A0A1B8PWL4_MORLA|nr:MULTISPECIES: peptide chain release factor N(5)-glutamine methyltransferase [Moraxella]MBE9577771.1 peptide chain release factor N(5)-glutamine methyltransferase [Moraxella sp. K1664]MBE9587193.1 peptide chain release factor N(5)-glutamine methyltransferase [Moraxella sp. K1630]MBE9595477.1 peptide chain release factor N(5)-glutamine methyltransferase [Moraxella sp. K2450]MDH9217936.1 peptide chain release factor N(5)-glutamine methyltransferase [Moraxella lacunata]MDI4482119.1 peptide chai
MHTINALKARFRKLSHAHLPYYWFESLLLFVLNKDKAFLITHDDYLLTADEYDRLESGMAKLCSGVPLAYVIGRQGFFGHEFAVNEHTLIPRPDTEMLVQTVLDMVADKGLGQVRIVDLGTGSGCIALSIAKALPSSVVLAVDYFHHALDVARRNAQDLQVTNCQFIQSNWYENIPMQSFDVIVANPPYIARTDEHLAQLGAEPITALVADNHGLSDIEKIIKGSAAYLMPSGVLALEHGYDQGASVQELFAKAGFKDVRTIKDYGDNDRITMGVCDE